MKRTFAAIAATALASTSIALAAAPAEAKTKPPAQDTATIRVVPRWTYQGGRLAVLTKCTYRQDNGTVWSSMLPKPVTLHGSGNVLIRVTKKTKPGKYTIAVWCATKKGLIDAFEETKVRILLILPGWKQPSAPPLPKHFKAKVTVPSGPPAPKPKKKKKAKKGH
jgi:hypothetical protein